MSILWKETKVQGNRGMEEGYSLWHIDMNPDVDRNHDIKKDLSSDFEQNEYTVSGPLSKDITVDVAIIGGGLAGILTAYMLKEQGISHVVLEKDTIGGAATVNTTAKITSQHGLIYQKILKYRGEERAMEYAMANQEAIERYEHIIKTEGIECDFQRGPSYVYNVRKDTAIRREAEIARSLGIPATVTNDTTLPFPVKAALRFNHQAQFHPMKFLYGIAKNLNIYEHTRITEIHRNGFIKTLGGNVRAKKIVIATHYPFINLPGMYFMKMHQERSYVIALDSIKKNTIPSLDGMYIDEITGGFSFRNYKDYLLLGGGNHRTGEYQPTLGYKELEGVAKLWYPEANIVAKWSNQDCMTPDSIPFIGKYSERVPNLYVITGFNKWGMTSSMVAAMILSEKIAGRAYEYRKVFYPRRLMVAGATGRVKDVGIVVSGLVQQNLGIPRDKLSTIGRGEGGVINNKGHRVGVYRDEEDKYYLVSTRCPHLGCKLEWNPNEKTWDCPCHGSRFDYHGNLLNNPSTGRIVKVSKKSRSEL